MNKVNAEKFIQDKIDMIQNTPEFIQEISAMLVNGEDSSEQELSSYINEYFGNRFYVADMVKDWFSYARMTYINLGILKNKDYVSVAMLNSTIFVHSFVEKFLK